MRVQVVKIQGQYFPRREAMFGWRYFTESLSPEYRRSVRFDTLEKAIEFLQSMSETEQVVYEDEI